jgi:hypothetical protein
VYANENNSIAPVTLSSDYPDAKFLSIEGVDAAGNTYEGWFVFNSSVITNQTRITQPLLEKLNSTHLQVSMPALSDNVTGKLQVSEDFGTNWYNIPFSYRDNSKDRDYAFYQRNSEQILYRVALTTNGITDYVHNIKSYAWDNTIYSLQYTNITTYTRFYQSYELQLTKSQFQNSSVKVQWLSESNEIIKEDNLGYSSSADSRFIAEIPRNTNGTMLLRFLVESESYNWSKDFVVHSGFEPSLRQIEDNYLNGDTHAFDIGLIKEESAHINILHISIYSPDLKFNRFIGINSFSNMSLVLAGVQNAVFHFYDEEGALIIEYLYTQKSDNVAPIILGDQILVLLLEDVNQSQIHWQVEEKSTYKFEIYASNITIESQNVTVRKDIFLPLADLGAGSYNFTLLVTDRSNNVAVSSTFVHIANNLHEYSSLHDKYLSSDDSSESIVSTILSNLLPIGLPILAITAAISFPKIRKRLQKNSK